ncbi:hypothetical protein SAMN05216193_107161 [Pseudomonas jinjuensis]|uniref:Uncharacterized protein n=1 Tax=Pseudomonas jinjuensis TaxID=198616 RepID=A0A1H0GEY1_9PSED|nr:hypothetical protein SAMN05216193_107161 [Pseudomonas jinjuensis]
MPATGHDVGGMAPSYRLYGPFAISDNIRTHPGSAKARAAG